MENDNKVQKRILRLKQELSDFRDGKTRGGRKMPNSIQIEILKLRKSGWSVIELEKEFQLASSAIYRWIKKSSTTACDKIVGSKIGAIQDKNIVTNFEKPKRLKIVEDTHDNTSVSHSFQSTLQMEFRSGVKLYIPEGLISIELFKSLNSL